MLGTNDCRKLNWDMTNKEIYLKYQEKLLNDYVEMAKSILNLPSKPKLFLMIPPPLYIDGAY